MKHKNIFFLTLCACVFLLSNAVGYWNVRSILTSAPWTSVETLDDFDTDGTFVLDTIECHNDNHWLFSLTGDLLITEGLINCEPEMESSDTIHGHWTLENNDTKLKVFFVNPGDGFNMDLYSIGPNQVEFHFTGSDDLNDTITRQRIILHR